MNKLAQRDLDVLDATARLLGELSEAVASHDEGDYYLTAHTGPGVRIWHRDGYSPGYFENDDDFWMFVADYKEAS